MDTKLFIYFFTTLIPMGTVSIPGGFACCKTTVVKSGKRKGDINLPSIIMGNAKSLGNKMQELTALVRGQREYSESSPRCLTETCLQEVVTDANITVKGFQTVWVDSIHRQCGKKQGGGAAAFVNNRWCSPGHIHVKKNVCGDAVLLHSTEGFYLLRLDHCNAHHSGISM